MGFIPTEEMRAPLSEPKRPLSFREEAVRARQDRLAGAVAIFVPISWRIIAGFLFISIVVAVVLLSMTSHAEIQTVRGSIIPESGFANIVAPKPGTVAAVSVKEGARVRAGDQLIMVRAEDSMTDGWSADARVAQTVEQQQRESSVKANELVAQAGAEQARIQADITGLTAQVAFLDQQIETQRQMVTSASSQLEQIQSLAKTGFVSGRDLEARKDLVLSRKQQLAELMQSRAARLADLSHNRQQLAQSGAENRAQIAGLRIDRLDLDRRLAEAQASSAYVLKSPISGLAAGIEVLPGDHVSAEGRLMAIVPDHKTWIVELNLPASSAGLVRVGQRAEVSIDAFPYARFGSVSGVVSAISAAPVSNREGALYRSQIRIDQHGLSRLSRAGVIRPGMGASIRIITSRESLLRWLIVPKLEPR